MVVITDADEAPVAAPGAAQPPASDDVQAVSPQGGDQENGQQQAEQPDWKEQLKSTIMRMIFFYMVMNWMKGLSTTLVKNAWSQILKISFDNVVLLGGNQTTQQTKPTTDGSPAQQGGSQAALNIFRPQMYYDFEAYLSSRYLVTSISI